MNKILLLAGLLIIGAAACKKTNDQATTEDSIRGTWSRTTGRAWARNPYTGAVDTTADYTTSLPSCISDDALEYSTNYAGILHLGGTKCVAGDPDTKPFRWEVTGAGTGLRIYDAAEYFPQVQGNVNASILTLTKTYMTLRYTQEVFYRLPMTQGGTDTVIVRDTVTYTDIFHKQ